MFLRIAIGVAILLALAAVDIYRNGRRATRWREYAFLLLCVAAAIAYGIVNDQITSRLSWEYFYYGKELQPILGPRIPPDASALHWQAVRIGTEATWAAGLIAGVAILLANNPRADRPQLSYRRLIARLPLLILIVAAGAVLLGIAGRFFLLNWISRDFRDLARYNLWRPRRFMAVYGIHLGGYVGGLWGIIWCVWSIKRQRRRIS